MNVWIRSQDGTQVVQPSAFGIYKDKGGKARILAQEASLTPEEEGWRMGTYPDEPTAMRVLDEVVKLIETGYNIIDLRDVEKELGIGG